MDPDENLDTKIDENVDTEISQDKLASSSKRTILKAAWIPPVIVAITIPRSGLATNLSGGNNNQGNNNNKQ